jgi:hypothetical protein
LTRFAKEVGFDIVTEFVEVETGKGSDALRPIASGCGARAETLCPKMQRFWLFFVLV